MKKANEKETMEENQTEEKFSADKRTLCNTNHEWQQTQHTHKRNNERQATAKQTKEEKSHSEIVVRQLIIFSFRCVQMDQSGKINRF